MKKTLSIVLAALLLCTLCVVFAAADEPAASDYVFGAVSYTHLRRRLFRRSGVSRSGGSVLCRFRRRRGVFRPLRFRLGRLFPRNIEPVSYTHLSQTREGRRPKRQRHCLRLPFDSSLYGVQKQGKLALLARRVVGVQNALGHSLIDVLDRFLIPVSYTHLDVYKRQ